MAQSCLTLCNPMDGSPPGSSVHGILQARTLEWISIPFSRESSQPEDPPDPGMEHGSPALQADSLPSEPPGIPVFRNDPKLHPIIKLTRKRPWRRILTFSLVELKLKLWGLGRSWRAANGRESLLSHRPRIQRVAILPLWFLESTHQYLPGPASLISMLPLPPELFIK